MNAAFRKPNELKLTGNVSENWKRFKQEYEIFLAAADLDSKADKRKVMVLLNQIGTDGLAVYNTFNWDDAGDEYKLAKVFEKFHAHCNPVQNETFERHLFKCRVQQGEETIDQFVTDLRRLSVNCNYGTLRESLIRDQVVSGVADADVKERLLRESDLTLDGAVKLSRAAEASKAHLKGLAGATGGASGVSKSDAEVHGVHQRGQRGSWRGGKRGAPRGNGKAASKWSGKPESRSKCTRCGFSYHKFGKCPALDKECLQCNKVGHFSSCCRSSVPNSKQKDCYFVATDSDLYDDYTDAQDEDGLFIDSITNTNSQNRPHQWQVEVHIQNKPVSFKIDSGAEINCISKTLCRELGHRDLEPTETRLIGYFGQRRRPLGKVTLDVSYKSQVYPTTFQVVDGVVNVKPVLGLNTCLEMNLIKRVYSMMTEERENNPNNILEEFPDVFGRLGCLSKEYDIKVDPSVPPVVHPPRRVPYAIRDRLKAQLRKMQQEGIIEKVNEPSEWVSSMVVIEKSNGQLRICIDPKDLNRAILREHYPMKTLDEVVSKLAGAKYFSVLDAGQAYYQVPVTEQSSKLLTFNTPFGRYRFRRMAMGIKSAPEYWQRTASQMFDNMEGVEAIMDDILVWGSTMKEHNERLRHVLERIRKENLTLNRDKCKVGVLSVAYMGSKLSQNGLEVTDSRIAAITQFAEPENKTELLRFLGMVNFVGKFVPNLSTKSSPLRELLKQDTVWHWNERHSTCMAELKTALTQAPVLAFFNPKEKVTVSVDASMKGLGACVMQNERPVAYASRTLSPAEANYANIEREMLAVIWGCEKFHEYLYGQADIIVESDHKPLEALWKKPVANAPPRIQRWMIRLQKYDVHIKYVRGKEMHIADALSRAPVGQVEGMNDVNQVVHVIEHLPVTPRRLADFQAATSEDKTLCELKRTVLKGWPENRTQVDPGIRAYWPYQEEITVEDGLLLKLDRLIVPEKLRSEMRKKIHGSHLGIEKCQRRARDVLFWPGMNAEIKDMVSNCPICLEFRNKQTKEPLLPHQIPKRPWKNSHQIYLKLMGCIMCSLWIISPNLWNIPN
jgi:hypothetical protein